MVDGSPSSLRRSANVAVAVSFVLLMVVLAVHPTARACPFCLSPPQTLAEQISRADLVLIAELVRFRVYDQGTRPESTLRIREYVRGSHLAARQKNLAVGQTIVIGSEAAGKVGDLFLMFGELPDSGSQPMLSTFADLADPSSSTVQTRVVSAAFEASSEANSRRWVEKTSLVIPEFISWNETTAISVDTLRYLHQLPPKEQLQPERLRYFLKNLEHPDPMIAIDAWAEFGNANYEDVVAVRNEMPREKLRTWISDPAMSPERLGLYGMMLGLCGTPYDAPFLVEQMYERNPQGNSYRFGSEGLMGGYLLLQGAQGLEVMEERIVLSDDTPDTASHAFVQALQFIWSYESDVIPQARIRQSMRLLLKNATMREIAITNLSRWEDWGILPDLVTLFDGECVDDRATQRAILQFAQTCVKAGKTKDVAQKFAVPAAEFISRVRETRPELLSNQVRDFGPPQ